VLVKVGAKIFSAGHLDQQARNDIIEIGVRKSRPNGPGELEGAERSHPLLDRLLAAPSHAGLAIIAADAGGVREQVTHGNACRGLWISQAEPGEILLHRRIQVQLACFHQLHHGQCRDTLGEGADDQRCLGRHGAAAAGPAQAASIDHLASVHDGNREAGQMQSAPDPVKIVRNFRLHGRF
jgi:hypothetical protein